MKWSVKVEAVVKRFETVDYEVEARNGDEARALITQLLRDDPCMYEDRGIVSADFLRFESVREA